MSYQRDLAYIHDVGFGEFARDASSGLLKTLEEAGITDGRVIDLGCGSGIWAQALCRAGYDVLGIDLSASMLEIAHKRVPTARFKHGSAYTTALPSCVALTALGECLNYRFDRPGRSLLPELFKRIYRALQPRGLFIFDIATPTRPKTPAQRHFSGDDWALLVDYKASANSRILTRDITIFRKIGETYRRSKEVHKLDLYPPAEVAADLREVGFRTRYLRRYGEKPFPTGLTGFAARKPG